MGEARAEALAAARRTMERIGRELERARRERLEAAREDVVEEPLPKTARAAAAAALDDEPVAVAPSARALEAPVETKDDPRIFSSDSSAASAHDLDAELGYELDAVLGDDELLLDLFPEEQREQSPLERALETLSSWEQADKTRITVALATVRAEPLEKLKECTKILEPVLAELRQSSDRTVASAARAARLRLFTATQSAPKVSARSTSLQEQLEAAKSEVRDAHQTQRTLRKTFNEATQAWQQERASLKDQVAKAEKKARSALQRAKQTADAARADAARLEREIAGLKQQLRTSRAAGSNPRATSKKGPAASSAFLRLQQRVTSTSSPAKRPRGSTSSVNLPACSRMVKSRTSDVSPLREAASGGSRRESPSRTPSPEPALMQEDETSLP